MTGSEELDDGGEQHGKMGGDTAAQGDLRSENHQCLMTAATRPPSSMGKMGDDKQAAVTGWDAVVVDRDSGGGAPAAAAPLPVIVYYHGSGFTLFSPAIGPFSGVCRRFCSQIGAVVVFVNYRLAPEHRYPAAYDDGVDAFRFRFLDDADAVPGFGDDVSVDLCSCFLAGESAGGNIVHHVANRWAAEHQPSAKSVRLAGIFPAQPYFGGDERTQSELRLEGVVPVVNFQRSDFSWKAFLPVGATRDHPAAHVTDENTELAQTAGRKVEMAGEK
ncbi:hypothetical protein ACQ4PT_060900 [Festuca glaucescens]